MKQEINEILSYLEKREDYVIWAGFAQFAHLGLECSDDIDIFISSKDSLEEISDNFIKNGWAINKNKEKEGRKWYKLEKNNATFDIVYSKPASELFFADKIKIKIMDYFLNFISKEVLFLTKLAQMTSKERSEEKRKRDLQVTLNLRDKVDLDKIRELVVKLPDSYWRICRF